MTDDKPAASANPAPGYCPHCKQYTIEEPMAAPAPDTDAIMARITEYLSLGGLFNPELANHDAVRDLLIDCRAAVAPAPATVDQIMALADEYAAFVAGAHNRYRTVFIEDDHKQRAALRAAIEQIVRHADDMYRLAQRNANDMAKQRERAERAERERDEEKKAADHWMREANIEHNRAERAEDNYQGAMLDLKRAERERDKLRELLETAKPSVEYMYATTKRPVYANLIARIDAALKEGK